MPTFSKTIVVLAVAILGTPAVVLAQTPGPAVRKSLPEAVAALSAKGYIIKEIEMDDGHFEASVINPSNIPGEAIVDAMTGEIVRFKPRD